MLMGKRFKNNAFQDLFVLKNKPIYESCSSELSLVELSSSEFVLNYLSRNLNTEERSTCRNGHN